MPQRQPGLPAAGLLEDGGMGLARICCKEKQWQSRTEVEGSRTGTIVAVTWSITLQP